MFYGAYGAPVVTYSCDILQGHLPSVSRSVAAVVQPEQRTPLPGAAGEQEDLCSTGTHPGSHLCGGSDTRPAQD